MKIPAVTAVLLAISTATPGSPAGNDTLTGAIAGVVSNALGIPQMGASVLLFNRLDRQVARTLTDEKGVFSFDSVPSGIYKVKVTLASFLPALRDQIGVQPGVRRVLAINLTGVLSSIELVYSLPIQQGLMSDDWKWALRGSLATRPILRVLSDDARDPMRRQLQLQSGTHMFTHTRGTVRLSAGDGTFLPTLGSQPDLGTAFALATSVAGSNHFEVSGNVGYASASGNPTAGFRTSFSRNNGEARSPEVSVTMQQIFLAGRAGTAMVTGNASGMPALRTMSVGLSDSLQVMENLHLLYGATLESVQFMDRVNYLSPFAKASYDLEDWGVVEAGFSSGLPPTQLYAQSGASLDADQQRQLASSSLFPRVSVRDGRALVQRTQNIELGYRKQFGSRTLSAGVYMEALSNAALTAVRADGAFAPGEAISDLFSTASIINGGNYQARGYIVALQQNFTDRWSATIAYGSSGVLEAAGDQVSGTTVSDLRQTLGVQNRHWVTSKVSGYLPWTSTRMAMSYQFMNGQALTPGHFYMTQRSNPEPGLNVSVRQPLLGTMGGKLEATAEVRNILAQGYQPMTLANGRRFQLVHSPRALRGGLAFVF